MRGRIRPQLRHPFHCASSSICAYKRGLNAQGRCTNESCTNFFRWIRSSYRLQLPLTLPLQLRLHQMQHPRKLCQFLPFYPFLLQCLNLLLQLRLSPLKELLLTLLVLLGLQLLKMVTKSFVFFSTHHCGSASTCVPPRSMRGCRYVCSL